MAVLLVCVLVGASVFEMKLVSWNVCGLGGFEKRKEVRTLVQDKKPFILCLQETKLQVCDVGGGYFGVG